MYFFVSVCLIFLCVFLIYKGKKIDRRSGPSKPVDLKGDGKKKTKRPAKKTQSRKRKADTELVSENKRFQQTVRCSLGEVHLATNLLKDSHRLKVRSVTAQILAF